MRKIIAALVLKLLLHFSSSSTVLSPIVQVMETGSFLQYITEEDANFVSCSAILDNDMFTLDIHDVKNAIPSVQDPNNLANRMFSLGNGLCGYKFLNATMTDPEYVLLMATDDSNTQYKASFSVQLYQLDSPMKTSQEVVLGMTTTISCGRQLPQSQDFCRVYNPASQLMYSGTRCSYNVVTVTTADIGTWICIYGIQQSMTALRYEVELKAKDYRSVRHWVTEENNDRISIGCKLVNYTANSAFSYCEMTNPRGESFVIRPGSATIRYTTLKTDLKNLTCAIELEKPLTSSETGLWKCRIGELGTVFTVGAAEETNIPRSQFVPILLNSKFNINCQVMYAATYCHISAPNGTRYKPDSPSKVGLGECSLDVKSSRKSDNGTWTCSFLKEDSMIEDVIEIEVLIGEVMGYTKIIETVIGRTAELSCHTGSLPLQYCRFVSPSKLSYHLRNQQTSDRVAYSGRGLEHGDCGIKIFEVREEDLGNWTCVIRVGQDYQNDESSAMILLFQDPSIFSAAHLATTIGVSLGVLFVMCGLVGLLLYWRWKKRRAALRRIDEQISFRGSSSENIINTSAGDYSATQECNDQFAETLSVTQSVHRRGKRRKLTIRDRNEERESQSSRQGGSSHTNVIY